MKNIFTSLIFIVLLTTCQNKKLSFEIVGKVLNHTKDYALYVHDTTDIGISTVIDTINIDNNENFNIKDQLLKSNALIIFDEETPIRLTIPKTLDTSLKIDLNLTYPDSIKIKGSQALFVKFHLDEQKYWTKVFKEMSEKHIEFSSRNNQNINYHKIQDTITKLRIEYLEDYFKGSKIINQEKFIKAEQNSLMYSNLYYRISGQKNDIVKRLKFYQNRNENSNQFLTYSDKVDFSDKNLFSNRFYVKFLNDVIMSTVRFENPKSDLSSYELYLNKGFIIIDDLFKSLETNKLQKIVFINHLISTAKIFKDQVDVPQFKKAIESLRGKDDFSDSLLIIEKELSQLNDLILKFSEGRKAPSFELEDTKWKKYSLSDFKNKIIFIDVWASWCGPCISSFPKWNKLSEDYSDDNQFEFLSVSIDKDRDKWTNALEKFNLKGLALYAGSKEFESPFAKSFSIKALPSYIALDRNGNIISVSSSINNFKELINSI